MSRFSLAHPAYIAAALLGCAAVAQAGASTTTADSSTISATDASTTGADTSTAAGSSSSPAQLQAIQVTAQRLNDARSTIETQTGASTYTIDSQTIAALPGGENVQLNQVLLQAPDVVQDSFGQIHVRADHNDLQYRLNGIILPEGISVFSQTLSPWLISSLKLITGALPAEYGLRTAGIIDLSTNSGLLQPTGELSVYGGSHSTFQPAAEYGGSDGQYSYFMTGDYKQDDLGIESPNGSSNPLHDHTTQGHAFGYFEDILDSSNRLSLILGLSDEEFQIPNQVGLEPSLGYNYNGITDYLSNNLNETQHELTEYAVATWQHSEGALNWQTSLSARYTSLHFEPDWVGDLLFNGIAQDAFKNDTAIGWQTDASYKLNDAHTVRAGLYFQHDDAKSDTTSQVVNIEPDPTSPTGTVQTSAPYSIFDNGTQVQQIESVYLQDEWKVFSPFTLNYGVRFDRYSAYSSGSQTSPRVNAVWQFDSGTTLHGGYSRYFTPPPFELVGSETFTKFAGTSAVPPGTVTQDTPPIAERSNYYDLGVQQVLLDKSLTLGIDSFYEQSQNLIDEGQFGAPIILTPFNYRWGLIGGIEFTLNYTMNNFFYYLNSAWQAAHGKGVESAQFNFDQQQLDYIASNYIHLDHEGRVSASSGIGYLWRGTRFSVDDLFGTGLRQDLMLPDGSVIPNGDHTPSYNQINLGMSHAFELSGSGPLTARFDIVNVADKVYQIRSGTGVGVFAPQYGPRRGFFGGLSWKF
ncbi:MAG TPA: TonB-dependent receptor [Steroidobacteraceae bacterium]|nr:TonB-dependent receptor [Steroidobacteraceae bacterium]